MFQPKIPYLILLHVCIKLLVTKKTTPCEILIVLLLCIHFDLLLYIVSDCELDIALHIIDEFQPLQDVRIRPLVELQGDAPGISLVISGFGCFSFIIDNPLLPGLLVCWSTVQLPSSFFYRKQKKPYRPA